MILDSSMLETNPHCFLLQLRARLQPQRTRYGYIRAIPTGAFTGVYDYGIGFLYIKVEWFTYDKKDYSVRFVIGCADDGSWGAWSETMSKQEAVALVEEINTKLLCDLISLPNETELNKRLQEFGLHGKRE